jgi:O6-methylguanine-DNA--protein-cysteine methyltransferase
VDGLPWYAENHGELFGVVARIDIKVGYSETESRKAASSMPNKHDALGRHHIPKMKFRVKNWAEYDAGLRRRGSLTLWVTAEVLDGWNAARRTTPGGQSVYSELAIETGMMLRVAFHLALRPAGCATEHA